MDTQLYDSDGNPIDLQGQDATSAYVDGRAFFRNGQKVPIILQNGEVGTVDAGDVSSYINAQGARIATSSEAETARLREEYGDQPFATGAEGFVRGLSMGLADPSDWYEGARLREQYDTSGAGTVGEIAGMIAPALVTGGGSAAASGASTAARGAGAIARGAVARGAGAALMNSPAGLVARAGRGAERVVERALGEWAASGGAARGIAARAARGAAGGAVEGALSETANLAADAALHDTELSGQQIASAIGISALFGAGLGGAADAAVEAVSRGTRSVTQRFLRGRTMLQAAEEVVSESAFAAGKPLQRHINQAARHGGAAGVGEVLVRRGIVDTADTVDDILRKSRESLDELYGQLDDVVRRAESAADVRPDMPKLRQQVQSVVDDLQNSPTVKTRRLAKSLRSEVAPLLDELGDDATMRQLLDWRRSFDAENRRMFAKGEVNPLEAEYGKLRRIVEDEVESSIGRAAVPDDLRASYLAVKKDIGAVSIMEDMASKTVAKEAAGSSRLGDIISSPLETGRKVAGAAILAGSLATGNFDAEHVGLAALVFASGKFQQFMRERRHQITAGLGKRALQTLGPAEGKFALAKAAQDFERSTADKLFRWVTETAPKVRSATRMAVISTKTFREKSQEITKVTSDPEAMASRLADNTASMVRIDQGVATQVQATAVRGAQYLRANMPPASIPSVDMLGQTIDDVDMVPDHQRMAWLEQYSIIEDPSAVISELENGTLTAAQVDALKAVYPAIYEQLVNTVMRAVASTDKPISYEKKLQLGILLGVPTMDALRPESIQSLQGSFAAQQQNAGPSPSRQSAPKNSSQMLTDSQRLASR